MIRITSEIVKKIFEQGKTEAPFEACGYLAGKNDWVEKYYPMTNVSKSEDHFLLDPKEQFEVLKEVRKEGFEILAVYHTHPISPARPSAEDIKLAYDPNMVYVIVSLLNKDCIIKAFKIKQGRVTEEVLVVDG